MMKLSCDVISALNGRTLATAESCTGGGIGSALTSVPGSSAVYKGGVICYTNWVKEKVLGVDPVILAECGPVSEEVARLMARNARKQLEADIAISVTGLAGPTGDTFGNSVGTVYIGYSDHECELCKKFTFNGDREAVRRCAIEEALKIILANA